MAFQYLNSLGEYTADNNTFTADGFVNVGVYPVVNESFTVPTNADPEGHRRMVLDYVPRDLISTTFLIDGVEAPAIPWGEVPSVGQVALDMTTGAVGFNDDDANKPVLATYTGIAKALMPYHLVRLGKELEASIATTGGVSSVLTTTIASLNALDAKTVDGPASSPAGAIPFFSDTTGKVLAVSALMWDAANGDIYRSGGGRIRFAENGDLELLETAGEVSVRQTGTFIGNDFSLFIGDVAENIFGYGVQIRHDGASIFGPFDVRDGATTCFSVSSSLVEVPVDLTVGGDLDVVGDIVGNDVASTNSWDYPIDIFTPNGGPDGEDATNLWIESSTTEELIIPLPSLLGHHGTVFDRITFTHQCKTPVTWEIFAYYNGAGGAKSVRGSGTIPNVNGVETDSPFTFTTTTTASYFVYFLRLTPTTATADGMKIRNARLRILTKKL
jgi:hypothetical protein